MTAREFQDELGSHAMPIAVQAGYTKGGWRVSVSRGSTPRPQRIKALKKALAEFREKVRRVEEEL